MERQEGGYTNRIPIFNGTNDVFWKVKMKTYIQSLRVDVWDVVEEQYQKPLAMISRDHKMVFTCNDKAINFLLANLLES